MSSDFENRLRSDLPRLADAIANEPLAHDLPLAQPEEIRPRRRSTRATGLAVAAAVIVAALAVPLALHATSGTNDKKVERRVTRHPKRVVADDRNHASKLVAAAVGTTVGTGSYRVEFSLTETAGTNANPEQCDSLRANASLQATLGDTAVSASGTLCAGAMYHVKTTGTAVVNTAPFAMRADSDVSNFGKVTVVASPNAIWEFGGANYGSNGTNSPGAPLANFAGLVEGTLGPREGALAMTSLASPNGYLNLSQSAIVDATPIGTGTVDGVEVQNYRVTIDLGALASAQDITADEANAISDALKVLQHEGYTGTTRIVSVDANGLIRYTKSTSNFTDGGTVVSENTFSQFGCAGVVTVPGQPVRNEQQQCWQPPAAVAPTTTVPPGAATTTTAPDSATTTTKPPTATSVASTGSSAATTTVPPTSGS